MPKRLLAALVLFGISLSAQAAQDHPTVPPTETETACVSAGMWRTPLDASSIPHDSVIERYAAKPVVLLGETHTSAEHHRWQAQMLAALHARNPNMVIGFEMLPRRVQSVMDAWIRGELDEKTFLERTDWNTVWRYDPALYMPLFHFARMHRVPIVALNVDQDLVRKVREDGWENIDAKDREGIGDPAPPSPAYEQGLREIFGHHFEEAGGAEHTALKDSDRGFHRFMQAQLTWDRAMAEALARVRTAGGDPLVVGIAGTGHLQYGHGIPHQLADLGIKDAAILLPWDTEEDCRHLKDSDGAPIADALFGVSPPREPAKPKRQMLGVRIETAEDGSGVRVGNVLKGSVAEAAGLKEGDVITHAAGLVLKQTDTLIAVVRRQAPGTWLPLKVERGGETLDVIARFPATDADK